jgi:DNA-binding LytR/AlgR family response regulator
MPTPASPRLVVAEDEEPMRTRLLDQLALVWPEATVVATVDNGLDAWDAFVEHQPDVLFLDIRMPGMSGLDVAARIMGFVPDAPLTSTRIVFVTAYDRFAVDAFEHGAVDYLLKPIERERLVKCVRRLTTSAAAPDVRDALRAIRASAPQATRMRWVKATAGRKIKLIDVDDILFLRADTKYTRVVHREALVRTPLRDLLGALDPEIFWQIHRSAVVNARAIESAERIDDDRLEVSIKGNVEKLVVSRAFMHLFRD